MQWAHIEYVQGTCRRVRIHTNTLNPFFFFFSCQLVSWNCRQHSACALCTVQSVVDAYAVGFWYGSWLVRMLTIDVIQPFCMFFAHIPCVCVCVCLSLALCTIKNEYTLWSRRDLFYLSSLIPSQRIHSYLYVENLFERLSLVKTRKRGNVVRVQQEVKTFTRQETQRTG